MTHQMTYISFLFFYFGKILRFPVIKMTGSVHTTSLLNTTQSQWSQVPNTYMHTYLLTYIICQIKTIQIKLRQVKQKNHNKMGTQIIT